MDDMNIEKTKTKFISINFTGRKYLFINILSMRSKENSHLVLSVRDSNVCCNLSEKIKVFASHTAAEIQSMCHNATFWFRSFFLFVMFCNQSSGHGEEKNSKRAEEMKTPNETVMKQMR